MKMFYYLFVSILFIVISLLQSMGGWGKNDDLLTKIGLFFHQFPPYLSWILSGIVGIWIPIIIKKAISNDYLKNLALFLVVIIVSRIVSFLIHVYVTKDPYAMEGIWLGVIFDLIPSILIGIICYGGSWFFVRNK